MATRLANSTLNHWNIIGLASLVLFGCQEKWPQETGESKAETAASHASAVWGGVDKGERRVHLMEFIVEGYEPLKGKKTVLDVGVVGGTDEEGNFRCEILNPRAKTKASLRSAAPFDFYTNVLDEEEQLKYAGELGEKDVFFVGDDGNRNGGTQSHRWTKDPSSLFSETLEFLEKKQTIGSFRFFIRFTRGRLKFQALLKTKALLNDEGKCTAATYLCAEPFDLPDGSKGCRGDLWDRQLHRIIANVDKVGALRDSLFGSPLEREKNDLSSLDGLTTKVDGDGRPQSAAILVRLAYK